MSLTRISSQERLYKKPIHRRKHSGELDVFEATMYYCEGTNADDLDTPKTIRQVLGGGGRRMSLDMNMRYPPPPPPHSMQYNPRNNEKQSKEKKHYKQPSSPGARLASFLNSLFNQKASKKKKSKSTTESVIEEEGSMRRRSSVSHFGSSSLWTTDSASRNSSSSSGFRTPPSYAKNQTKVYKDLRKYSSDHDQQKQCINREVISSTSMTTTITTTTSLQDKLDADQKRKSMDLSWLDEKIKLIDGLSEKKKKYMDSKHGLFKKDRIWIDEHHEDEDDDDDDGGESDSSSDLFELQNCDLGLYSNGLPVYETTHIESIKRGTVPISSTHL